jgi:hypothetical protein
MMDIQMCQEQDQAKRRPKSNSLERGIELQY